MGGTLTSDTRELLASARALIAELAEEGVEQFERRAPAAVVAKQQPDAASDWGPDDPNTVENVGGVGRSLEDVRQQLGNCTRCQLCEGRSQIVFGDGNPDASLMFIGEGPGQEEDRRGLPFVGRAGELLTRMIERGLEISRSEVYICNIVKCRPPNNRTPKPDEVTTCKPFLDGQIDAVRPRDRFIGSTVDEPTTGTRRVDHASARHLAGVPRDSADADVPPGLSVAPVHT